MVQVATQGPQEMDRITRRILDPDLTSDLERDGEAERERETVCLPAHGPRGNYMLADMHVSFEGIQSLASRYRNFYG